MWLCLIVCSMIFYTHHTHLSFCFDFGKWPLFSSFAAGTRESAFVHAISAAGIAFAVTLACSRGELEKCGCDRRIRGVSPEGNMK